MSNSGGTSPDPGGTGRDNRASEPDKDGSTGVDPSPVDPSHGTEQKLSRSIKTKNKNEKLLTTHEKDNTNPDKGKVDAPKLNVQQQSSQINQLVENNSDNVGSLKAGQEKRQDKKRGNFVGPEIERINKLDEIPSSKGRSDSASLEDFAEKHDFVVVEKGACSVHSGQSHRDESIPPPSPTSPGTDALKFENIFDHADDQNKNLLPTGKDNENTHVGNRKCSNGGLPSFKEIESKDEEVKQTTDRGDKEIRVTEENSSSNKHFTNLVSSGKSVESEEEIASKTDKSLNVKPISGESETDLEKNQGEKSTHSAGNRTLVEEVDIKPGNEQNNSPDGRAKMMYLLQKPSASNVHLNQPDAVNAEKQMDKLDMEMQAQESITEIVPEKDLTKHFLNPTSSSQHCQKDENDTKVERNTPIPAPRKTLTVDEETADGIVKMVLGDILDGIPTEFDASSVTEDSRRGAMEDNPKKKTRAKQCPQCDELLKSKECTGKDNRIYETSDSDDSVEVLQDGMTGHEADEDVRQEEHAGRKLSSSSTMVDDIEKQLHKLSINDEEKESTVTSFNTGCVRSVLPDNQDERRQSKMEHDAEEYQKASSHLKLEVKFGEDSDNTGVNKCPETAGGENDNNKGFTGRSGIIIQVESGKDTLEKQRQECNTDVPITPQLDLTQKNCSNSTSSGQFDETSQNFVKENTVNPSPKPPPRKRVAGRIQSSGKGSETSNEDSAGNPRAELASVSHNEVLLGDAEINSSGEQLSHSKVEEKTDCKQEKYTLTRLGPRFFLKSATNEVILKDIEKYRHVSLFNDLIFADDDTFKICENEKEISLEMIPVARVTITNTTSNTLKQEDINPCRTEAHVTKSAVSKRMSGEDCNKPSLEDSGQESERWKITVLLRHHCKKDAVQSILEKDFPMNLADYMKCQYAINNELSLKLISEKCGNLELKNQDNKLLIELFDRQDIPCIEKVVLKVLKTITDEMKNMTVIDEPVRDQDGQVLIQLLMKTEFHKEGIMYAELDRKAKMIYCCCNKTIVENIKQFIRDKLSTLSPGTTIRVAYVYKYIMEKEGFEVAFKKQWKDVEYTLEPVDNCSELLLTFHGPNSETEHKCSDWFSCWYINRFSHSSIVVRQFMPKTSDFKENKVLLAEFLKLFTRDFDKLNYFLDEIFWRVWFFSENEQAETGAYMGVFKKLLEKGISFEKVSGIEDVKVKETILCSIENCKHVIVNQANDSQLVLYGPKLEVEKAKHEIEKVLTDMDHKIQKEPVKGEVVNMKEEGRLGGDPGVETTSDGNSTKTFDVLLEKCRPRTQWDYAQGHVFVCAGRCKNFGIETAILLADKTMINEITENYEPKPRFVIPIPEEKWNKHRNDACGMMKTILAEITRKGEFNIGIVAQEVTLPQTLLAVLNESLQWLKSQNTPTRVLLACSSSSILKHCMEFLKENLKQCHQHTFHKTNSETECLPITVQVVKENIAEVKADVLAHVIGKTFDLSHGAVSMSLSQAAGPTLQTEVNLKKSKIQKSPNGDIIITGKSGLNGCRCVFHGSLKVYAGKKDIQDLENFVLRCLMKADELNYKSIAFPAIGTGELLYPTGEVSKAMFKAVESYIETLGSRAALEKIIFVVYKEETCFEIFKQEEKLFHERRPNTAVKGIFDHGYVAATEKNKTGDSDMAKSAACALVAPSYQQIERGESASTETNINTWDHNKLERSKIFEKYVEVVNVPAKSTFASLEKSLELQNSHLIYCNGQPTALVLCSSQADTERLMSKSCKSMTFKKITSKCLINPWFQIDEKFWRELNQNKELLGKFTKDMQDSGITITETENSKTISAPTLYQIAFAYQEIRKYRKRFREPSVTENIDYIPNVSDTVWQFITWSSEMKKLITNNIKIDRKDNSVMIAGSLKDSSKIIAFKDYVNSLPKRESTEISVTTKASNEDVYKWCSEINDARGYDCCCYIEERKNVLVFCKSYDDLIKVRHQFKMRSGDIKATGRNQRSTGDDHGSSSSHFETKKSLRFRHGHPDFNWDVDAKYVEKYKTSEGINVFVYKANILKLPVQCIVNAANDRLSHGGGVAKVIADAAGNRMLEEDNKYLKISGKLRVGNSCSSLPGKLPYALVIHTVGPDWQYYKPYTLEEVHRAEQDLSNAILNSFREADKHELESIALPAISSAIFGVPKELCVYQYAKATVEYSQRSSKGRRLKEIHFIDVNYEMVKAIQDVFNCLFKEGKAPDYDSRRFVKIHTRHGRGSNRQNSLPSYSQEDQHALNPLERTDANEEPLPSALAFFDEVRNSYVYMFCGENQKLILCRKDIMKIKADSIALTVSPTGHLGQIGRQVFGNLKSDHFKRDLENKNSGDVALVSRQGTAFNDILLVVIDTKFRDMNEAYKKKVIKTAYIEIFDLCDKQNVSSVSLTLIGIDNRIDDEVVMCSEVFVQCYLNHCTMAWKHNRSKALTVYFVFKDDAPFGITQSIFDKYYQLTKTEAEKTKTASEKENHDDKAGMSAEEKCAICLESIEVPKTLTCGHTFCIECIENYFKFKQVCPMCGKVLGTVTGDQPEGTMTVSTTRYPDCTGFPGCGQIVITYDFPSGRQGENHPNPGSWYKGFTRIAYLPNNERGNQVLQMLRIAFDRKLVFTIGRSRTTGQEGVITWNDIHHKTDNRPYSQFGYPDPGYLDRVIDELSAKGITIDDIKS